MINEIIHKKIHPILKDYSLQHKTITKKLFEQELHKIDISTEDFPTWIAKEIQNLKGARNNGTITTYDQMLTWLKKYDDQFLPEELTPEFVRNFEDYMIKKGLNLNTRSKHLKNLKVFSRIYWKNNNALHKCPFQEFKIKKGKGNIVFLDKEELKSLNDVYDKNLLKSKPLHHIVLRMFLFSVYVCGMRISDIMQIGEKNIYKNIIKFKPVKTEHLNKEISFELTKRAIKIINDIRKDGRKARFFDEINEDTARKYLKEIADMCGIRKNLSMHVARHTFATNYYRGTKDIVSLRAFLGHSKVETTMIYTHYDDKSQKDGLDKFEEYLNS